MARNGAGTFSVINPIVVGALRSSSAVNQNFTDMGSEITGSLPTDGRAAMSGQLKVDDGSALLPGLSFDIDGNTGFRRSDVDEVRWVGGGQDRAVMDASGKLKLNADLSVTGSLTATSGKFNPQTLSGTGAARLILRRTENDTTERELATYSSGSGSGAKGSLRAVGGGANDVQTMRFYVNDVLTFQWTGTLFTHSLDTLFGAAGIRADADGFLDLPEISSPTAPAANVARVYSRDASGVTGLYLKDASGSELPFQTPVDRQVFTASGTWTKPTQGQTQALIECWGAGGAGKTSSDGGGGGGAYSKIYISIASVSAAVSITVGSGGTGSSGSGGGNSSFGTYLNAFGGGGASGTFNGAGGSGGGLTSAGITVTASNGGDGGGPNGFLSTNKWGLGYTLATDTGGYSNPFGGGGGDNQGDNQSISLFGGAGGSSFGDGCISVFGGGGGSDTSGGQSIYGGNGGSNGVSGSAPGGGGGNNGGSGARGEVRVTCW